MSHRALIIAALALMLVPFASAQSRREAKNAPPPPVISQTIEMRRGGQILIPLGIHGARGEMLEFLIRTPPTHGRLSAVKNTAMNTATVTYISSTRGAADGDRFAYAVHSSEGVSAPGLITIRFVEPVVAPAKLRAPNELEFPAIFPGQRSTAEMEIANEGGGILEGEVAVPEPWSIEGLKIFKIAAGKSTTIKLVFSPAQPGVRTGEAIISGTGRKIIPLRATTEERLAATPPLLKLTAQPGSQTRMGVLKIANHSAEDAAVSVEAGPRLLTKRSVNVPARGTSEVPVFADAGEAAAFDDVLKLSSNEWKASVPVRAVAVGPILKFAGVEVSIAGQATASGVAILENAGGEAVTVRLEVERPFAVESLVTTAPARGRVEIPISVRDAGTGTFRSSLKATGEGGSATVAVLAEITEPPRRLTASRVTAEPVANSSGASSADSAPQESETSLIPQTVREIPNALGKFGRGTGATTATLEWPADLGPVENLRIEERVLSLSTDDELEIGWSPLTAASITSSGERVTAELRGLKPGTLYTVRVVNAKDTDSSVLFTTEFWTVAKKPVFTASLRLPLLVLALGALAYAIWRSRRAPIEIRKSKAAR